MLKIHKQVRAGAPGEDGAVGHEGDESQAGQHLPQRLTVLHALHVRRQRPRVLPRVRQPLLDVPAQRS